MANSVKKVTDRQIEVALKNSMGIISQAVNYLKKTYNIEITRQGLHQRINKSKRLSRARDDARENMLDICESTIMKAIVQGDSRLAFQVICKLGKQRGYTDNDVNTAVGTETKIIFDVPNIDVEQEEPKNER